LKEKTYKNIFVVDTNIILNSADSLFEISENSNNLIVLPETVLDELDTKKGIMGSEISYQARKFGRILADGNIIDIDRRGGCVFTLLNINHGRNVDIVIASKERYITNIDDTENNIKNDRKILEIAQDVKTRYSSLSETNDIVFLSMDVMARHRAISLGIESEPYDIIEEDSIVLYSEQTLDNTDIELKSNYTVDEIIEYFCIDVYGLKLTKNNQCKFYYRVSNAYIEIDEKELARQNIKPINAKQKILSSMMLDDTYDVVTIDAPSGSGKTAQALSAAMKLMDTRKDKYDKIVYIRETVLSSENDLGFLPGTLEEKLGVYLQPLYSTLEYIVQSKNKNKRYTKEELESKIQELIEKYNIQSLYSGFLRGSTIRNAIVISDEAQNMSVSAMKTLFTRVDDNSKIFCIGSTVQIDAAYVSKSTNALTYLLSRLGKENDEVRIGGMELTKTIRSRIAEWADKF